MKKFLLAVLLMACAAPATGLTLMSYNVRNLFDDVRDGTEYREFDPTRGTWTTESFLLKVDTVSAAIRKAVRGGPDVLVLQEVENARALDTLVGRGLRGMGYTWKVIVPRPGLAANVAIVSRLPVRRVGSHALRPWKGTQEVRDIVEAEIDVSGSTLHVFCLHWKSKTEGVKPTERARREAAAVLAARLAEIFASDTFADVVAAGDFNECVDEYARTGRRYATALMPEEEAPGASAGGAAEPATVRGDYDGIIVSGRPGTWPAGPGCTLFDPWLESAHDPPGSYLYQGEWLSMDHILMSRGLFDNRGLTYRRGSFRAVAVPSPAKGAGSDHLPVVVTIDRAR